MEPPIILSKSNLNYAVIFNRIAVWGLEVLNKWTYNLMKTYLYFNKADEKSMVCKSSMVYKQLGSVQYDQETRQNIADQLMVLRGINIKQWQLQTY